MAALSRLDVGPAYYEDPVSSNPTYTKGRIATPLLGWSYEAYLLFIKKGKVGLRSSAQERTSVFLY